jgi:hypothetical protein
MKSANRPPSARQSTEGDQEKTNTAPFTPECVAGLVPTRRFFSQRPRITLTPLKYGGQYWGWLARSGGKVVWGSSKDHARWRMKRALRGE